MHRSPLAAALGAAATLAALPARGEPAGSGGPAEVDAAAELDDVIGRPLVLDRGELELRLTAAVNVQPRNLGRPVSLAPDAWWGVSPRLTIGIIHSDASLDQIATTGSLCVRERAFTACDRRYHGSGVDLRYAVRTGQFALAPRVRVLVRDLDPFKPAVTLGGLVRWTHGRFAIASDPYVRLPLANAPLGNRTSLMLPLWLAVQPAAGWAIALHTGFSSDVAVLGDGWHGAFGLDVTAHVAREVDLGLEAGWGSLFGPQEDARHATVMIGASWRPGVRD